MGTRSKQKYAEALVDLDLDRLIEATRAGQKRYESRRPCPKCGGTIRWASTLACVNRSRH